MPVITLDLAGPLAGQKVNRKAIIQHKLSDDFEVFLKMAAHAAGKLTDLGKWQY